MALFTAITVVIISRKGRRETQVGRMERSFSWLFSFLRPEGVPALPRPCLHALSPFSSSCPSLSPCRASHAKAGHACYGIYIAGRVCCMPVAPLLEGKVWNNMDMEVCLGFSFSSFFLEVAVDAMRAHRCLQDPLFQPSLPE